MFSQQDFRLQDFSDGRQDFKLVADPLCNTDCGSVLKTYSYRIRYLLYTEEYIEKIHYYVVLNTAYS